MGQISDPKIIEMMGQISACVEKGYHEETLKIGKKLVKKLDREPKGIIYFMMTNASVKLDDYKQALIFCKKAADCGHDQAPQFISQIENLI